MEGKSMRHFLREYIYGYKIGNFFDMPDMQTSAIYLKQSFYSIPFF